MGKLDKNGGKHPKLTRRQFLQASAATAAVGAAGFDFAAKPMSAAAQAVDVDVFHTTCPYCSASCGQLVAVEQGTENVVDVYGDHMAPWNAGGLCSKGAGTFQLVNNDRRLGAFPDHPDNGVFSYDPGYEGIAYKRTGNDGWTKMDLQTAMNEAAVAMVAARGDLADAPTENNSKSVAFFGSSHMTNDENYLYRKLIANFGTSNIEHQARI